MSWDYECFESMCNMIIVGNLTWAKCIDYIVFGKYNTMQNSIISCWVS